MFPMTISTRQDKLLFFYCFVGLIRFAAYGEVDAFQRGVKIILSQYVVERALVSSLMSDVFLTRHIATSQYRIIKHIHRGHPAYEQLSHEGDILRNLDNRGFPRIFDIIEDKAGIYLIEEYMEGESVKDLHLRCGCTPDTIRWLGIKLCELIGLMHNAEPTPMLYLDLKPEHIKICGNGIRLVDFGAAGYMYEKCILTSTPGFCAPELENGKRPDVRTDIYGIGAVMFYLLTGRYAKESRHRFAGGDNARGMLGDIVEKAISVHPGNRYSDISQMETLLRMSKAEKDGHGNIRRIAVLAAKPGGGATHLAVSITSYLNACGRRSVYQSNECGDFFLTKPGMIFETGVYRYLNFSALAKGECHASRDICTVTDMGSWDNNSMKAVSDSDKVILIADAAQWESGRMTEILWEFVKLKEKGIVMLNRVHGKCAKDFCKRHNVKVVLFPPDGDPYQITPEKESLFGMIL